MLSEYYRNRMKMLSGVLSEASSEEIYQKYYASKIPEEVFKEIVASDPTSIVDGKNIKKIGNYSKWLLSIYINKKLKLEDLYKATDYLSFLDKNKNKLKDKGINLDINKYKNLADLFQKIQPYIGKNLIAPKEVKDETELITNDYFLDNGEAEKKEFGNNWIMFIPKTLASSQFYGCASEWCTLRLDNFKYYTERGDLFIFINKSELNTENPYRRIQVHLGENQFMDMNDDEIDKREFLTKNRDILDYLFEKQKGNLVSSKEYKIEDGKYYLVKDGWADFAGDFNTGRDISKDFIKDVLAGDSWQYFENYNSDSIELRYACDDIDDKNKTRILNIISKMFPGFDLQTEEDIDDILSSLSDEEDASEIEDAIKNAYSDAQRNADESEAHDQLIKEIIKHFSVVSTTWKDGGDKLYLEITEAEFKFLLMGLIDEGDEEIDYSPPYRGYNGDIDAEYFNENLSNQLYDLEKNIKEPELKNEPESVNEFRLIIRKMIEEDYRFEYNKKNTPTDSMSLAAKKAQQISLKTNLIAQYKAGGGLVTGEKRSTKIISKTPLSHNEIRALRDLFTSLESQVSQARSQGKNINNSAVIQIWELNGGDAGKSWVNGILGSHHDSSMKHKELRRGYGDVGLTKNMMKSRMPKKQNPK